jgi:hypothetical protein
MDVKKLSDEELLTAYLNAIVDGDKKLQNKIEKEIYKRNNKED